MCLCWGAGGGGGARHSTGLPRRSSSSGTLLLGTQGKRAMTTPTNPLADDQIGILHDVFTEQTYCTANITSQTVIHE